MIMTAFQKCNSSDILPVGMIKEDWALGHTPPSGKVLSSLLCGGIYVKVANLVKQKKLLVPYVISVYMNSI